MPSSRQLLDQAYTPAHFDSLDPASYAAQVATELSPATSLDDLAARDAQLVAALAHIDTLVTRAMRVRLDHALAADPSLDRALAAPTRNVFAQTIANYANRLDLLASRARDVAARAGGSNAEQTAESIADLVVATARSVLDLRDALRAHLLTLVRDISAASIADADRRARDRQLDDTPRRRWSAARRELEAIAAEPSRIAHAAFAARLASHEDQLDEPDPEREPTLAELIELD